MLICREYKFESMFSGEPQPKLPDGLDSRYDLQNVLASLSVSTLQKGRIFTAQFQVIISRKLESYPTMPDISCLSQWSDFPFCVATAVCAINRLISYPKTI